MEKESILNPDIMFPKLRSRSDDEPGIMAEMAIDACNKALAQAGRTADEVDLVICAASNHERAYPAIAVEIQDLLGAGGFAFDMNVACSSATFGLQAAADMIRAGSVKCALVVNPEICSGHLEWRDRDCHFIFRRRLHGDRHRTGRGCQRRAFPCSFHQMRDAVLQQYSQQQRLPAPLTHRHGRPP